MNQKKHAYLIIAHEEFEVLQKLVEALDDKRNDIFIHMDKKVRNLPVLRCKKAGLSWVENRVDVCWGHVSQIESEYVLFEAAKESGALYAYYHLISGTHMPLKSQEAIHAYFNRLQGKQVLNFLDATPYEVNFKMNRFHFFIKNHRHAHSLKAGMAQLFWRVLLRIQTLLRIKKKALRRSGRLITGLV